MEKEVMKNEKMKELIIKAHPGLSRPISPINPINPKTNNNKK